MAFDYKKEYKEFYLPKAQPQLVTVPPMNYIAVRGQGDPNEEGGAYKAAAGRVLQLDRNRSLLVLDSGPVIALGAIAELRFL